VTSHAGKIARIVSKLLDWYPKHARDLPWRRTNDPYRVLISEIMLQQTQVKTVLPYWERWMRALPDLRALAEASPDQIHKLWEGLGYYHRVRNLQKAAKIVVEKHGSEVPKDFEALLDLPGIGRYTAGAICSIAFGQPKPILDGNIIRVLTRLFGITGHPSERTTNARLWRIAENLVQEAAAGGEHDHESSITNHPSRPSYLNQSLMELGALVCTKRQPACHFCPVAGQCVAYRRGLVHRLPNLKPRAAVTRRRFAAFVISKQGLILVRQRAAGQVNAHLWEFPNVELNGNDTDARDAARSLLGKGNLTLQKLFTIKHSITRYRIQTDVFAVNDSRVAGAKGKWLLPAQLRQLAFCGAHKKIINEVFN
jgi:A/G-specific adenine glycosylase